jgi:hypothetical protein
LDTHVCRRSASFFLFRHCERSEAIQSGGSVVSAFEMFGNAGWIASSLRFSQRRA